MDHTPTGPDGHPGTYGIRLLGVIGLLAVVTLRQDVAGATGSPSTGGRSCSGPA